MNNMKRIFFILCLICITIGIKAQQYSIEYTYDDSGNRLTRYIVNIKTDTLQYNEQDSTLLITQNIDMQNNTQTNITNTVDNTQISLYPNPATDFLNINIINSLGTNEINLFTINGKLLQKQTTNNSNSKIDLTNLSPGTYIIRIKSGNYNYQQKIIKK